MLLVLSRTDSDKVGYMCHRDKIYNCDTQQRYCYEITSNELQQKGGYVEVKKDGIYFKYGAPVIYDKDIQFNVF